MSTSALPRAASLAVAAVELIVVEGPDRGAHRQVETEAAHVGTGSSCQLRLTDKTVSRLHCSVELRPDGVRVVDSGSTNGTFVDGVRVRDAFLVDGATLRVGTTGIRVELGPDPLRLPLSDRDRFGDVLGGSAAMRRLYAVMERVAPTDATVLIQGETGTGKELVARAIHDASRRASAPFVAVDCGAIAASLIESELFGHVKGAFSGALADRAGLFEAADGGTVFLDEIGELPMALQPKLLRALETREIRRVGSNAPRPVDVRVLAATNRPLDQSVNLGSFREDLYYRLAVVELMVPALRARREDIPALAAHFARRFSGAQEPLRPEIVGSLLGRSWPGNVRELRNFIERYVAMGLSGEAAQPAGGLVLSPALSTMVPVGVPYEEGREAWAAVFDRTYVEAALRAANGNVTKAAEAAGMNRRFLYRIMARLGMKTPSEE